MVACAASGDGESRNGFAGGEEAGAGGGDASSSVTNPGADTGANPSDLDAASANDAPLDVASDVVIEVGPTGNPLGFPCAKAADCQSNECKNVLAGSATSICVTPCTQQTDCADGFFCDPTTPGAASGFCAPRSPAHCKTCAANADCGSLSETCGVAAGDTVKACHVDCTIGGAAACPADYTCEATTLDGNAAKVCRPAGNLSCLDALGGFCDRVATPQTCSRTNAAGTCVGQRTCLTASTRYNSCGASAPVYKATCSSTDPAGCTTSYATEATSSPQHCGACNNACPGLNTANAVVACNQPTCSFACNGETYDVDANKATGCEVVDATTGNHSTANAVDLGNHGCDDDDPIATVNGRIVSDNVTHSPAIAGYDSTTKSAPDYYKIKGTSGTCSNNPDITLNVNQAVSGKPTCYHLRVETDQNTYDCDTDANGNCRIDPGGFGKYSDDSYIYFIVSKRSDVGCAGNDNAPYTITGHL